MLIKDHIGIEVEIKGDPWPLGANWFFFPATNVLLKWNLTSFIYEWNHGDPIITEQDFLDNSKVYALSDRESSFIALKLLTEDCIAAGRHDISFKLRQLLEY